MLALPGGDVVGFTNLQLNLTAVVIFVPVAIVTWMINGPERRAAQV